MNQNELINVLEDKFLKAKHKIRRILINGKWGIGKTHCWESFTELVSNKNKESANANKGKAEQLKTIKVSLFGVNSIEVLDRKLKIKIAEALGDNLFEGNKVVQKGVQQAFSAANKKFAGGAIDPLVFINVKDNHIICFDDLERKSEKLTLIDVLGYIDEIAQTATVIIIANEDNIPKNEKENYLEYKEKIIEAEYHLTEISDDICAKCIEDLNLKTEYKKIIIDMFNKFGNGNLRTLSKIKYLIGDFCSQVENINGELIKMCVAVVINEYNTIKEPKEEADSLKYKEKKDNPLLVFQKFNIHHSAVLLEYEIRSYLKENKFDKERVNRYLNPKDLEIEEITNLLFDIYLFNESILIETVDRAMTFVNELKGPYFLDNLLRIVGYIKYYNHLYDLKLQQQKIDVVETNAQIIIEKIIASKSDMKELDKLKMKIEQKGGVFGINELIPYITNLLDMVKNQINKEIRKRYEEFIDRLYTDANYYECFEKITYEPDLIKSRLHYYDDLLVNPSQELFSSISDFTWHVQDAQLKPMILQHLTQLKQNITDKVIVKRIDLVIERVNFF